MNKNYESFHELYEDLLDKKISMSDASDLMKSKELQKKINYYINHDKINKLAPFSESELQELEMIINIAQYIYNNSGNETGITDNDYDLLYSIMLENDGTDIITVPLKNNSSVEHHKFPSLRGTLKKVFYLSDKEVRKNPSRRYLSEWLNSMENKIYFNTGNRVDLSKEEIYLFPKYDGVSAVLEYDENGYLTRALTRGYTELNEAENITQWFKEKFGYRVSEYYKGQPYGLKTEVMMMQKDLDSYNLTYGTNYKNTRSIVSAILNSDDYDEEKMELLQVVPLREGNLKGEQAIAREQFKEFPYLRCLMNQTDVIKQFAEDHYYVHDGLRCDGAVLYIINEDLQKVLGRENNINNYEVAYKFTEENALTKLLGITFNVGLFGRLAPVANIKPVKLKGNTIDNVSLGSIGRVKKLELRKGDTVKVLYDIIPYLDFDKDCSHNPDGKIIRIPRKCPDCDAELFESQSGSILTCLNPDCPCRVKGKILNYLDKMNIENISYGVIDRLYDLNILTSIEDLYTFIDKHRNEMLELNGIGPKKINQWKESIEAQMRVPDYQVLGALGIEGIAKKTFQKIMDVYGLSELLEIVNEGKVRNLISIPGIQTKTAWKLIEGIRKNLKLIRYLQKVLIIYNSSEESKPIFYRVCFTKVRDKDIEDYIDKTNGEVVDRVTRDTTFLVIPNTDITSSKVEKAKKYGIRIITIENIKDEIDKFLLK